MSAQASVHRWLLQGRNSVARGLVEEKVLILGCLEADRGRSREGGAGREEHSPVTPRQRPLPSRPYANLPKAKSAVSTFHSPV